MMNFWKTSKHEDSSITAKSHYVVGSYWDREYDLWDRGKWAQEGVMVRKKFQYIRTVLSS